MAYLSIGRDGDFEAIPDKAGDIFEVSNIHGDYPFNLSLRPKYTFDEKENVCGVWSIFDKANNTLIDIEYFWGTGDELFYDLKVVLEDLTLRGEGVNFFCEGFDHLLEKWDGRENGNNEHSLDNEPLKQALEGSVTLEQRLRGNGFNFPIGNGYRRYASDNWRTFGAWHTSEQMEQGLNKQFHLRFDNLYGTIYPSSEVDFIPKFMNERLMVPFIKFLNPVGNELYDFNRESTPFSLGEGRIIGPKQLEYTFNGLRKKWSEIRQLKENEFTHEVNDIFDTWRSIFYLD